MIQQLHREVGRQNAEYNPADESTWPWLCDECWQEFRYAFVTGRVPGRVLCIWCAHELERSKQDVKTSR